MSLICAEDCSHYGSSGCAYLYNTQRGRCEAEPVTPGEDNCLYPTQHTSAATVTARIERTSALVRGAPHGAAVGLRRRLMDDGLK